MCEQLPSAADAFFLQLAEQTESSVWAVMATVCATVVESCHQALWKKMSTGI